LTTHLKFLEEKVTKIFSHQNKAPEICPAKGKTKCVTIKKE